MQWWGGCLLTLWVGAIPCAYAGLIVASRAEIRRRSHDGLAGETRFLWNDYTPVFFFWEVVETYRKLGRNIFHSSLVPARPGSRERSAVCIAPSASSIARSAASTACTPLAAREMGR